MTSISIAMAVAVLTFASGLLGLYIQKWLPKTHLSGGSKDMILAVIGLLTLLLALVLGTLVGNTYAFFATQKSELASMASRALLVDQALEEYGPEAKAARSLIKQALTQSYDLF
jgi:heme A synthase